MIKKIIGLIAVLMMAPGGFVLAQTTTSTPTAAQISCIKSAVASRESAISNAFNTFSDAQKSALSIRSSALSNAWSRTTASAVRTAVNAAWKVYRTAHNNAVKTHNTATRIAWKNFRSAFSVCRPGNTGLPMETQGTGDSAK